MDEIGEISPYIQVKLLRVLQEKEIERVGDSRKRKVDIRVITATNKDLKFLVNEGSFREDLYYRLKVFPIFLPPLRERKEDIPLLIRHFIDLNNKGSGKAVTGMTKQAMQAVMDYEWPGNVRELANAVEHAFVLCTGPEIVIENLPLEIRHRNTGPRDWHYPPLKDLVAVRRPGQQLTPDRLKAILHAAGWNKAEAARQTGLSRASVWKYMKKWNIPMQPE